MDEYSAELSRTIVIVLPGWVERCVTDLVRAWRGSVDPAGRERARVEGELAAIEVGERLAQLLALDVDAQRTTPLALLRDAVSYPTRVLRELGCPEVVRDEFAERTFPADVYNLTPAAWRDVDERLHDPGLAWGAWKAHEHLRRRRGNG